MKKNNDDFLDNLDEMEVEMPKLSKDKLKRIHDIELEKIGVDNMNKNSRKNAINFRRGLVAACLVVAIGAAVPSVMNRVNGGKDKPITNVSKGEDTKGSETKGEESKVITELKNGEFVEKVQLSNGVLNFGDATAGMATSLYFDPAKTTQRKISLDEYIEYMGTDPRPTYVPEGLKGNPRAEFLLIENNDGTTAYDNHAFWYQGAEHSNFLRIEVSKGKLPINCAILSAETETKSNINGVEINVGYRKQNTYIAKFIYNGVGYEIESKEVSQEDFIKVLTSIIK